MGNTKGRRRRFGSVRQLRSGQWQARYQGPDGIMRPADQTFPTRAEAERWLTRTEVDILDGDWIDPVAGLVSLGEYAATWINERPNLRPKTVRLYKYLLRCHLVPVLGSRAVAEIKEPHVRHWRKGLLDAGTSPITAAKAYRLLKAIMNTAVDDGLIRRNPCRIKGAGQEKSPERPVLTIRQVFHLIGVIDPRYRAIILLAVFASLRWGELAALRRKDIDLSACTVSVVRTLTQLSGGGHVFGPPKSDAGQRTIAFPDLIVDDLTWHLGRFAPPGDDVLVFTSPTGALLDYDSFRRRVWMKATEAAGLHEVHFHDLRHTGNMLTAEAGATLREMMDRMGHSSTRAALVYLHATSQRQRTIADAVGTMTRAALREIDEHSSTPASGTDMARGHESSP
jgi:integrase